MYNIEKAKEIIEEKGCTLITKEYKNCKTKMEILCSCGEHTFWVNLSAFMAGKNICDECMEAKSGKRKWIFERVREYASSKGVELLSTEYKNQKGKLEFICPVCKLPFVTDWATFLNNNKYTCNECSRKRTGDMLRLDYDTVKRIVEELGSELLSKEYINAITPILVKCTDCGKPIFANFGRINYNKTIRCAECGYKIMAEKQTYTYEQVKEIIESDESGCKLLSTEYNGHRGELILLCGCGKNTVTTTLELFQTSDKKYCPDCGGRINWTIELAKQYVLDNSDCELLDTEYTNNVTKMSFKCGCGNLFYTDMKTFIYSSKHQCNQCSSEHSNLQLKCHDFLENNNIKYFSEQTFKDCINPLTNCRLRYDFYIPNYNDNGLLIEGMGIQHEKAIRFYNAITEEEAIKKFEEQKYRDELKRKYAEEHNIELLYIWYYELDDIPNILTNKLILPSQ